MTHHIVTADVSRNCSDSWWTDRETGNKSECFLFTHTALMPACVNQEVVVTLQPAAYRPTAAKGSGLCWGLGPLNYSFISLCQFFVKMEEVKESDANMLWACL